MSFITNWLNKYCSERKSISPLQFVIGAGFGVYQALRDYYEADKPYNKYVREDRQRHFDKVVALYPDASQEERIKIFKDTYQYTGMPE